MATRTIITRHGLEGEEGIASSVIQTGLDPIHQVCRVNAADCVNPWQRLPKQCFA